MSGGTHMLEFALRNGFLSCVVLLAVIQFLIVLWVKTRLDYSVKYEYEKILTQLKYEDSIRHKASMIAEFLSKWQNSTPDNRSDLNRYSMELSLVLPAEIYKELKKCLNYSSPDHTSKDVLISIRKYMLGKNAGDLAAGDIFLF